MGTARATSDTAYSDIKRARKLLNFKPSISLEEGPTELAEWAKTHGWATIDLFERFEVHAVFVLLYGSLRYWF